MSLHGVPDNVGAPCWAIFLPYDYGLDSDISLCKNSIAQSIEVYPSEMKPDRLEAPEGHVPLANVHSDEEPPSFPLPEIEC